MDKIFYSSFVYDSTQELLHPIKEPGYDNVHNANDNQSKHTDTKLQTKYSEMELTKNKIHRLGYRFSIVADPDPGSGAFLTPGSGIGLFQVPDLGSQTLIFESVVTIYWVKTSIIL